MSNMRKPALGRAAVGASAIGAVVIFFALAAALRAQEPAFFALPAGAAVKIVEPANGATVRSPVKVVFSVNGAAVKPAGTVEAGTGHHHLLINAGAVAEKSIIPADATHLHFGKGQTETSVPLKAGEYTLTLQFADALHRSYGPQGAHTIKITVSDY